MGIEGQEESRAIDELKKRIKRDFENELYGDDTLFYRFLKARDFNIDHAETMLKEHLKWRKKYDVENISKYKHPEVLEKYFPLHTLGHDKEGNVLHFIAAGKVDWIGLNASSKQEDLAKHVVYYFEEDFKELKRYRERTGKTADKVVYIVNMEDFSFAQATSKKVISSFVFLINLYQDNYPEMLRAINVIKASPYFYILYTVIKKFLPTAILNKLHVYGDDSWKEDFLESMDADVLPAFLGGNRTDPDGNPMCLSFINHGAPVPTEYYIHRSKRSLANLPGFKKLTLTRRDRYEIPLNVAEKDWHLEWEFETKSRDIGFGMFHKDEKGNTTEILPIQRVHTDEFSETGIYKCEKVGTYVIVFDNTYSVLRKKDIFYKISVLKSQVEETDIG